MMRAYLGLAVVAALVACGCRGKLLARAELRAPGTATVRFVPAPKERYRLWADTEGIWTGPDETPFPVAYDVQVKQGGKVLGRVACDSRTSSGGVCGGESNLFGEHTGDCEYKLTCELPDLGGGEVALEVRGYFPEPGRVKRVRDMSLMVRKD